MKRRGFIAALVSAPVVAAVAKLPVPMTQTPQAAVKASLARTEYRNGAYNVYDKDGLLRVRLGVF